MSAKIFISYRREDSADVTGRIYDRLVQRFGEHAVFKDVDSIPLGTDFRKHLESVIGQCAVVLVVIGDNWAAKDAKTGARRLDNPEDFVRVEIEWAMRRGIPVIPLLVEGASMPPVESLPEGPLREFAYRNGTDIGRDPNFHPQVNRLIEKLEEIFGGGPCDQRPGSPPRQSGEARPSSFPASHVPPAARASAGASRPSSGWKILLLALGGLAALFFAGVVVLFLALAYNQAPANNQPASLNTRPTPAPRPGQALSAPDVPAASETLTYTSRDSEFEGELEGRFVDFSFDYPASWHLDPNAGQDNPYIVVVRRRNESGAGNLVLETFSVTFYESTGTLAGDRPHFRRLARELSSVYRESFPNYTQVSEGETKVGPYTGYEFRFKVFEAGTRDGDITYWGRGVLLPNPGQHTGVALVMVATSHSPEFSGADDVGLKGETPVILNSFRLGR